MNDHPITAGGPSNPSPASQCPRCGASFVCEYACGNASCWCAALPRVMPIDGEPGGCLCASCLSAEIERRKRVSVVELIREGNAAETTPVTYESKC